MSPYAERLRQVLARIRAAERHHGREPGAVTLLAVSKQQSIEAIRAVAAAGQHRFGENYLQEALPKIEALAGEALAGEASPEPPLEWHFIGPLQSNKTRPVAEHFAWVHSVDRFRIAQRLSEQRPDPLPPLQVCLQVNISSEASKSGVEPEELPELAARVAELPRLRLRGLMAIPAPCEDFAEQRRVCARLRECRERLVADGLVLDTLSIGMSDDLEAAIAEGSTLVRIGTAIFGPRNKT